MESVYFVIVALPYDSESSPRFEDLNVRAENVTDANNRAIEIIAKRFDVDPLALYVVTPVRQARLLQEYPDLRPATL